MSPDPIGDAAPPERRQAVWPWLLVPLVALAMFFMLSKLREAGPVPEAASSPSAPVSSE